MENAEKMKISSMTPEQRKEYNCKKKKESRDRQDPEKKKFNLDYQRTRAEIKRKYEKQPEFLAVALAAHSKHYAKRRAREDKTRIAGTLPSQQRAEQSQYFAHLSQSPGSSFGAIDADAGDGFTTAKTQAEKKRKVSSDGNAVSVEAEADAAAPVPAPPDFSDLSPIEKILRVDLWKDDLNAVQSAVTQLADLCFSGNEAFKEENRATVYQFGGAVILPGILRKWYGFPDIQAQGIRALQNASIDAAFKNMSVKDSGGLDAIIWAMKSYPDNYAVQTSACGALGNVFHGVKEHAEYLVNTLNGVDWIVAAMKKFPHDAMLQLVACGMLDNLLEWDEFKDSVKQAGGCRALVEAIKNHQDESKEYAENLQRSANHALKALLQ